MPGAPLLRVLCARVGFHRSVHHGKLFCVWSGRPRPLVDSGKTQGFKNHQIERSVESHLSKARKVGHPARRPALSQLELVDGSSRESMNCGHSHEVSFRAVSTDH
jgi:hypothetical protein